MTKGESSVKEPRQEIVPEIDGKNVRTLALATKMWDSCRGLLKVPPGTKQRSKEGPFGHNRRRTKKSVVKTASSLFHRLHLSRLEIMSANNSTAVEKVVKLRNNSTGLDQTPGTLMTTD